MKGLGRREPRFGTVVRDERDGEVVMLLTANPYAFDILVLVGENGNTVDFGTVMADEVVQYDDNWEVVEW